MKSIRSLIPHQDGTTFWVQLTKGKFARIDKEDAERVGQYNWHTAKKGTITPLFYARATVDGEKIELHRFLTDCPADLVVDHLNFDGLDNRRANLNVCPGFVNNSRTRRRIQEEHLAPIYAPTVLQAEPQPVFDGPLPPPRLVPAPKSKRKTHTEKLVERLVAEGKMEAPEWMKNDPRFTSPTPSNA